MVTLGEYNGPKLVLVSPDGTIIKILCIGNDGLLYLDGVEVQMVTP